METMAGISSTLACYDEDAFDCDKYSGLSNEIPTEYPEFGVDSDLIAKVKHFASLAVVSDTGLIGGTCESGCNDDAEEQTYEQWIQSLRDVSIAGKPFEDHVGLVANVWVEGRSNSDREFLALVRAHVYDTMYDVAEAIQTFMELQLPSLEEPLHYQTLLTNISDDISYAGALMPYGRLRLMIFVYDPREDGDDHG